MQTWWMGRRVRLFSWSGRGILGLIKRLEMGLGGERFCSRFRLVGRSERVCGLDVGYGPGRFWGGPPPLLKLPHPLPRPNQYHVYNSNNTEGNLVPHPSPNFQSPSKCWAPERHPPPSNCTSCRSLPHFEPQCYLPSPSPSMGAHDASPNESSTPLHVVNDAPARAIASS
jgi:hypothetical protein